MGYPCVRSTFGSGFPQMGKRNCSCGSEIVWKSMTLGSQCYNFFDSDTCSFIADEMRADPRLYAITWREYVTV
jgi:hypothetical protein